MISTDSAERKNIPVFSGFVKYFPLAMARVAQLSLASNEKHNPGQPLHWSKDISNDHADCLMRHQMEVGKMDTDGFTHTVKVAWRAMAQLEMEEEERLRTKKTLTFAQRYGGDPDALDVVQSDGERSDYDNRVREPELTLRELWPGINFDGATDPTGTVVPVSGVEPSSDNPDRLGVFQRR